MTRRFLALVLVLALALVLGPREAAAQSATERAHAAQLKKQGDELVHTLHYREALVAYDGAYAFSHDPAILYNRGRALDALGETPQALDAFEEFLRLAPASLKGKVPKLDELVASVRARVATLVIHCPVEGANVFVRRRLEGTTPLPAALRVPTGTALVEVQAAGYQPYHAEMELGGGAPTTVEVALVKVQPVEPAPTATTVPPAIRATTVPTAPVVKDGGSVGGWTVAAYAAGGVGVAGIASGAIFGVLALTKQNGASADCPANTCNPAGSQLIADARTFATASTVSFVVGGVGLATSVLLFLLKPSRSSAQGWLSPVLVPTFGGLAGSF
jgi:hypothetical protein